ncbi:MAG: prepilin-type N-terminal cleavage/methylation domain-containing protein [Halopseudomonas sp.]
MTARRTKSIRQRANSCHSQGFTLIELIITIVVLSVALLGVAHSLQYSAQHGSDTLWQTQTVELVQAYSDEILTKKFDHNTPLGGFPACNTPSNPGCTNALGPEAGEQRSGGINSFDDVDDYHGLDDSPPVDAQGSIRSEYSGFRVQVSVSYAGTDLGLADNLNGKLIHIVITPPYSQTTSLPFSVYRGNY